MSTYIYDSILKSRDITLLTEVRLVKAMVFPVVMYGCESWTVKQWLTLFFWAPKSLQMVIATMKLKGTFNFLLIPWKESYDQPR